jgi:hypothetical protein
MSLSFPDRLISIQEGRGWSRAYRVLYSPPSEKYSNPIFSCILSGQQDTKEKSIPLLRSNIHRSRSLRISTNRVVKRMWRGVPWLCKPADILQQCSLLLIEEGSTGFLVKGKTITDLSSSQVTISQHTPLQLRAQIFADLPRKKLRPQGGKAREEGHVVLCLSRAIPECMRNTKKRC